MKCPACGFENLRGTERCISCRARLILPDRPTSGSAMPPRAGILRKWVAPWRRAGNRARQRIPSRLQIAATWLGAQFNPVEELPGRSVAAIYLSLIPGFGHMIVERRWLAGLAWGGAWLALLGIALCFWGNRTAYSLILAGFPLSCHVSIMADAGRIRHYVHSRVDLLRIMLLQVFLPCLMIYAMAVILGSHFLQLAESPFTVSAENVRNGDILLFQTLAEHAGLHRGDLVATGWNYRQIKVRDGWRRGRFRLFDVIREEKIARLAQVMAFPGDQVEISGRQVKVNGALLPMDLSPWNWEESRGKPSLPAQIKPNHVLLFDGGGIIQLPRVSIEARSLAIWFPLGRRHFFPVPPNVKTE